MQATERKTDLTGSPPPGRQGEAWRVTHEVADAHIEPVAAAWREELQELSSRIVLADLVPALERRDVDAAIEAIPDLDTDTGGETETARALANIHALVQLDAVERIALDTVEHLSAKSIASIGGWAYKQEGDPTLADILGERVTIFAASLQDRFEAILAFAVRLPLAEEYAAQQAADLVQGVSEETKRAIRDEIIRAFRDGFPPASLARRIRDLSVGLTRRQAAALYSFEAALRSGDPAAIRLAAERRLDAPTQQQIRTLAGSAPIPEDRLTELVARYRQSLINARAINIARTETINAAIAGQFSAWSSAMEQGILDPSLTRVNFIVTPDDRLCLHICAPVPAMNPGGVPFGAPFVTPIGLRSGPTLHPGCRCSVGLTFVAGVAVARAR